MSICQKISFTKTTKTIGGLHNFAFAVWPCFREWLDFCKIATLEKARKTRITLFASIFLLYYAIKPFFGPNGWSHGNVSQIFKILLLFLHLEKFSPCSDSTIEINHVDCSILDFVQHFFLELVQKMSNDQWWTKYQTFCEM